jgi:hypothetical protein
MGVGTSVAAGATTTVTLIRSDLPGQPIVKSPAIVPHYEQDAEVSVRRQSGGPDFRTGGGHHDAVGVR